MDARLDGDLTGRDDLQPGYIWHEAVIEPGVGKVHEKVAATNSSVVSEISRGPTLMDGGECGGLDRGREVRGEDKVVNKVDDNGEERVG